MHSPFHSLSCLLKEVPTKLVFMGTAGKVTAEAQSFSEQPELRQRRQRQVADFCWKVATSLQQRIVAPQVRLVSTELSTNRGFTLLSDKALTIPNAVLRLPTFSQCTYWQCGLDQVRSGTKTKFLFQEDMMTMTYVLNSAQLCVRVFLSICSMS